MSFRYSSNYLEAFCKFRDVAAESLPADTDTDLPDVLAAKVTSDNDVIFGDGLELLSLPFLKRLKMDGLEELILDPW
jgi:hypothetical protein